ncbi:MAG: DUF2806 domain-containing protein [Gammaproteobacteria bacterium]|nr:DUF2806 domain-containing protein [Gammaproteobacteria bacterium]
MLGEKLLIKLWDTLADRGVSSLLTPWQILREADARIEARRRELIILADAERKAEDIRKGNRRLLGDGTISETGDKEVATLSGGMETVENAAERRQRSNRIREEVNINKAIIHAEQALTEDPQDPPDRDIDDDWINRWKEYASKVSADDLQQLWGNLLAGEVKSPGSYSLRTLDFLRNISKNEAQLIEKAAQFNIAGCIAREEEEIMAKEGITFSRLLSLQELGVIVGVEAIGMTREFSSTIEESFQQALLSNGKVLLVTHADVEKKLELSSYGLSSVGEEILSLGSFQPNQEYLVSIANKFVNKGFTVKLCDWTKVDEKRGRISNAVEIEADAQQ